MTDCIAPMLLVTWSTCCLQNQAQGAVLCAAIAVPVFEARIISESQKISLERALPAFPAAQLRNVATPVTVTKGPPRKRQQNARCHAMNIACVSSCHARSATFPWIDAIAEWTVGSGSSILVLLSGRMHNKTPDSRFAWSFRFTTNAVQTSVQHDSDSYDTVEVNEGVDNERSQTAAPHKLHGSYLEYTADSGMYEILQNAQKFYI